MRAKLRTVSWVIIALSLIIAFILVPVVSYAAEVTSINVRGKTVQINDTADQVFTVLKASDMVDQTVKRDPNNPNSLLLVKNYKVEGKKFTLYFARVNDPGPYRVVKITMD
jgi:hypothetical protein